MRHKLKHYYAAYDLSTRSVITASSERALQNKVGGGPEPSLVLAESMDDAVHRAHQLTWEVGDDDVRVPCSCQRCREARP